MEHASSIYLHIINGDAGPAGEFMARLALHLGHDSERYPMSLAELAELSLFSKGQGWLTEYYAVDLVRAAVFGSLEPWRPDQVERLMSMIARH